MRPRKRIGVNYLLLYAVFHVLEMENGKKTGGFIQGLILDIIIKEYHYYLAPCR